MTTAGSVAGIAPAERLCREAKAVAFAKPMPDAVDLDVEAARTRRSRPPRSAAARLPPVPRRARRPTQHLETTAEVGRQKLLHQARIRLCQASAGAPARTTTPRSASSGTSWPKNRLSGTPNSSANGREVARARARDRPRSTWLSQPIERPSFSADLGKRQAARLAQRADIAARAAARRSVGRAVRHAGRLAASAILRENSESNFTKAQAAMKKSSILSRRWNKICLRGAVAVQRLIGGLRSAGVGPIGADIRKGDGMLARDKQDPLTRRGGDRRRGDPLAAVGARLPARSGRRGDDPRDPGDRRARAVRHQHAALAGLRHDRRDQAAASPTPS